MDFEEWEPIYERILQDFGYDRGDDSRARDVLDGFVGSFDLDRLALDGERVAVAGGSPTLRHELDQVRTAAVVYAASTAADVLQDAGLEVDLVVTDLDKTPQTAIDASHSGIPVAVHAHGDNIPEIRRYLPEFDVANVLGTTQAAPTNHVENFGGFTDGDRAGFIADSVGAGELVFPGWDFEDQSVNREKRKKLAWAERLLFYLQRRRGEEFDILAGRDAPIDRL